MSEKEVTLISNLKGTLLSDNFWYKQYWMSYSISVVFRQKWNIERGLSRSQSWSLLTYCIYTKSLACVWVKKSVFFLTNHIPAWHPVINNKPDVARRYFLKKANKTVHRARNILKYYRTSCWYSTNCTKVSKVYTKQELPRVEAISKKEFLKNICFLSQNTFEEFWQLSD